MSATRLLPSGNGWLRMIREAKDRAPLNGVLVEILATVAREGSCQGGRLGERDLGGTLEPVSVDAQHGLCCEQKVL